MSHVLSDRLVLRLVAGSVPGSAAAAALPPALQPDDPRWALAVRAASLLEGGRAAILTADRRRALMSLAAAMGLRPFDAALVIAIVQDAARTGRHPFASTDVAARLALLPPARADDVRPARFMFAAALLAGALVAAAVAWLGL